MKYRALLVAGVLTSVFWAACNCGKAPLGSPCKTATDCDPGDVCSTTQKICTLPDGGTNGNGNGNGDGGNGNGNGDGGNGNGNGDGGNPDGGNPCVNLQCQQVTCPGGGTTSLTGKVYDPSGTVPLYNALIYVPNGQVKPFTDGVSCDQCGALTSGSPLVLTLTGADGSFTLNNVPAGSNIPLVIQIGRWRRQVTIPSVTACTSTAITDVNLTRMPRNQSEGDIPLMAIATGSADPFECLLRKMGISDSEFTLPTGTGRIHYYVSNGYGLAGTNVSGDTLWGNSATLQNYDVVLLPCEGGENAKGATNTQNIINYTSSGGRVFTTHYGYVWIAMAQAPFPSTGNWQPDTNTNAKPPDPFNVTVDQSFPKGAAFAQWLVNVGASPTVGQLSISESRHDIWAVNNPPSTQWISGNVDGGTQPSAIAVEHLTFNTPINPPALPDGGAGTQCGRVVYSDFHVSASARTTSTTFPDECKVVPLSAQEKALVFMLFDLSSCIQNDKVAPSACESAGQSCASNDVCCTGLSCLAPGGAPCNGGESCTCNAVFR